MHDSPSSRANLDDEHVRFPTPSSFPYLRHVWALVLIFMSFLLLDKIRPLRALWTFRDLGCVQRLRDLIQSFDMPSWVVWGSLSSGGTLVPALSRRHQVFVAFSLKALNSSIAVHIGYMIVFESLGKREFCSHSRAISLYLVSPVLPPSYRNYFSLSLLCPLARARRFIDLLLAPFDVCACVVLIERNCSRVSSLEAVLWCCMRLRIRESFADSIPLQHCKL